MKEWVKALYIGYHQALDLPKNLFPFPRTVQLKISLGPIRFLSSPRAESARAVTGRRNSHRWEGGRLFDGSAGFFTETAVTPERKVEKSFPRWEINRHDKG